tara:strand:+ start:27326 stop:28063 length:738 start_codon:yes stop_codon:yes gene_type:complete
MGLLDSIDFWIGLFIGVGIVSLYYARHQPFPEYGNTFGWVSLIVGLIFLLGENGPRDTSVFAPSVTASIIGGFSVIYGVREMVVTKRDVIVAPFGGVLLSIGAMSILSEAWIEMNRVDQIVSFILVSIVIGMEIYLAFRGLVIGVQGITWSKSGLRQVNRGLLEGPHGAISHFERSWDMEDQWINAMSHAALALIYQYLKKSDNYKEHVNELEAIGGWGAVDDAWIEAIKNALDRLNHSNITTDD